MPVPGMPTVRVTRPELFAEIRAPLTPALIPMLLGVTVILMPGAILNDLRTLNPIGAPTNLSLTVKHLKYRFLLAQDSDAAAPSARVAIGLLMKEIPCRTRCRNIPLARIIIA